MNNIKSKLRKFHQAKWDEQIIFELNTPNERGIYPPKAEKEITKIVGNGISKLPRNMIRKKKPELPEVSQMRVLKHFLRLSQHTLGADFNIDIGQGTCTIKYNPKINELISRNPKVTELHPYQDENSVQGALEIIFKLDLFLREISGLDHFTFQPPSGSAAILTMASIVQKYFEVKGEEQIRDEVITTIFSHPSDYSAAAVKGYKVKMVYNNPQTGLPDMESFKKLISNKTAAIFITNPEDTGIFNPEIKLITDLAHKNGAICCYDQANANGILGITRAKEAGFDMCFFNLHKTFSTPHGCGGPATGALGVVKKLYNYLPIPNIEYNGKKYILNNKIKHTIGKVRAYPTVFPVVLKAYAWIMSLGSEGLKEVANIAVLNNNYLLSKITKIKGASAPYAKGKRRIEQVRYSWEKLHLDTGVTTEDVTLRMADFGFHLWSSHHPFIVKQPFTIEPTEAYSKDELDEYINALSYISKEAYSNPDIVKLAPHNSVVHKIDHSWFDDPTKWSITWRLYKKKHLKK
ncbi:MAG: aminomethyl-transferring glycine dehydrogenase subunit GcvPB [Ignavibacteriae bacterium]|nr:aminomethyl-transferring glycine dehydrogenase subunit GcvPB [Ignavibacteriota bacterium]MCB9211441.1 aminomethyl-transferring glycine dehydrogenase subunit GcvPB [Ignavibacteriales bacterium]MCB9258490.1 aminomethyl-transferring glycine dehydrogenase subunit GcvPB [Ignavibacteriales bacterium]